MANHPSAAKRNRQTTKRRLRNRVVKGRMRTALKAAYKALADGKKDEARTLAATAIQLVERASVKGVVKRNTASRLVSKLTRQVNA